MSEEPKYYDSQVLTKMVLDAYQKAMIDDLFAVRLPDVPSNFTPAPAWKRRMWRIKYRLRKWASLRLVFTKDLHDECHWN